VTAPLHQLRAELWQGSRTTRPAGFRRLDELRAAVDAIPRTVAPWRGEEGPRWLLTVSPGSVQLGTKDYAKTSRSEEERVLRRLRDNPGMTLEMLPTIPTRGQILGWSQKSRANMARTLTTLDYSPILGDDTTPAMVTLTVPGEWQSVAGTPDLLKRAVNRFRAYYRGAYGHHMPGVWKMEFQRRGAPHLHILTTVPAQRVPAPRQGRGRATRDQLAQLLTFREWVAVAWSLSLDHKDPNERAAGLRAGTRVDEDLTLRYGDAKRVAVYFAKHGAFNEKEYQNELPDAWRDAIERGESGGARYWGYWKLRSVREVVEVDASLIIHISRELRKFERSRAHSRPTTVYRVDQRTGVVRTRRARRRVKYLSDARGFLAVNDGAAVAHMISRLVDDWMQRTDFFAPESVNPVPRSGTAAHSSWTAENPDGARSRNVRAF